MSFDLIELEPPIALLLGAWGLALPNTSVIFAHASTRPEAEALALRLEEHAKGGYVDPLTGRRYLAPAEVADEGRPSLKEVAGAIRANEARTGERCAAYVGLNPNPGGLGSWPPCVDWTDAWRGACPDEAAHPLLDVFPVRLLTGPEAEAASALPPGQRLAVNDLWGLDVLPADWPEQPLDAEPWNRLVRAWELEAVFPAANLMAEAVMSHKRAGACDTSELALAHYRVCTGARALLAFADRFEGVSEQARADVRAELDFASQLVARLTGLAGGAA